MKLVSQTHFLHVYVCMKSFINERWKLVKNISLLDRIC